MIHIGTFFIIFIGLSMKQILQILADYLNKVRRKLEKVIKSDIKNYIKLKA